MLRLICGLKAIGAYYFNGDLIDGSINSYNATNYGITFDAVNKKLGSACAAFNGTAYGSIPYDLGTPITVSVAFWIFMPSLPAAQKSIVGSGPTSNTPRLYTCVSTAGKIGLYRTTGTYVWSTGSITAGAWNFVVVTDDGTNTSLFINNVASGTGIHATLLAAQTLTYIGKDWVGTLPSGSLLDCLLFFDRILTVSEMSQLWNAGNGAELNPKGYSSSGEVVESSWLAIDQNTLDATIPIHLFENSISGTGSLLYQYAINNGAYNGVWLTQAQLIIALQGQSITDHTNSLRLQAQLNSNGTQQTELVVASYAEASGVSGGGGGGSFPIFGGSIIRAGVN